ncbi:MAG: 16S rRNA (cytidine(1402)-2'-O)-methyltransferase [Actinomycetes bacterium]
MTSKQVPGPERVGRLVLAATPIGNPGDATDRLRLLMASADVVAAEDTRRVRRLAASLGVQIAGAIVSYYDAVEVERIPGLLETLRTGGTVLLLTDAGTPSVSDPGYRLVTAAIADGIAITGLPGPSAVLLALTLSGLPVDRFAFEGFLPRKSGERRRRLSELASDPRTLVFFEAPHRLAATLADIAVEFGPGRATAVCRELTKTYEEVRRGAVSDLAEWAAEGVRGEITIVIAGAARTLPDRTPAELAKSVAELEASGSDRKAAIAAIATTTGLPKREVYAAVVAARS